MTLRVDSGRLRGRSVQTRVRGHLSRAFQSKSIDADIAAAIGTGPIETTAAVKSATVGSSQNRAVVDVVVGIGDARHTVAASIEDRSHMEYPVLLGRDILGEYNVDIQKPLGGSDGDSAPGIGRIIGAMEALSASHASAIQHGPNIYPRCGLQQSHVFSF